MEDEILQELRCDRLEQKVERLKTLLHSTLNDICRATLSEANSMCSRADTAKLMREAERNLRKAIKTEAL